MVENSAIEWTHHTFNPWIGCTKISPACDHCYAEAFVSGRMGKPELWKGERRRTAESTWKQPLRWDEKARKAGERHRVFCASLADVFDNQVPAEWRLDLWALIRATPSLDWLLLTKRPQNIAKMLPPDWFDGMQNVWLGTTVENQTEADRRIPHLLSVPARVRFLSVEPLLGPIEFSDVTRRSDAVKMLGKPALHGIHWVIAGGESGPGARPSHPNWHRSLRDQCAAAGVPFLFKQWGDWLPLDQASGMALSGSHGVISSNGTWRFDHDIADPPEHQFAFRFGKKAAGRLLDGVLHDGYPVLGSRGPC